MSILTFIQDSKAKSIAIFSQHLPSGPAWEGKARPESNLFKLLKGMVTEFSRVESQIQNLANEHDINQTLNLLTEWETSVGIPDSCFTTTVSLAQRRINIRLKLGTLNGTVTDQDFVDIATILGFNVTITAGADLAVLFPLPFPLPLFADINEARFTMRVQINGGLAPGIFPIPFPVVLTPEASNILECVFNLLKPAVTTIQFTYTP
ncbi:MAG: DUF2313 domain-containing protein [Nitrosopumilus sp.]